MWMGLNLPPGNRGGNMDAVNFWHGIGGPAWCVLVAAGLFVWAALQAAHAQPSPVQSGAQAAASPPA